tara:strand:+ start:787 stop:1818 length:1032 start_codon:yes stop_codon:yes gene_type:complete
MAWGLDSIKEGLTSLEKGMKDTVSSATNTGKEKMKSWSESKEGIALIDVALSLGMNATGSASKSADTAEAFITDVHKKKDELTKLGRKLVDKKSYEAGEKALDLQADVEKFVSDNVASFEKSIKDVMKKDSQAAERGRQADSKIEEKSFLDTLNEAKESSMKYTSKMVAGVSDKATEFKGEVAKTYGVSVEKVDELAASAKELSEKSGSFAERLMKSIGDTVGDIGDTIGDKYSEHKAERKAARKVERKAEAKAAAAKLQEEMYPGSSKRNAERNARSKKIVQDAMDTYDDKYGVERGGLNLKSDSGKLDGATDKQLAAYGMIRVKAFTRKDGVKIKQHYRKI